MSTRISAETAGGVSVEVETETVLGAIDALTEALDRLNEFERERPRTWGDAGFGIDVAGGRVVVPEVRDLDKIREQVVSPPPHSEGHGPADDGGITISASDEGDADELDELREELGE